MRRVLPLILLIVWLTVPVFAQPLTIAPPAADKPLYAHSFALLIGINDYQHVKKLEYAVNDVTALRDVLVNLYGFPAENVTVLTDAAATKAGIATALSQVASKARVGQDDRMLIYFSGHGQTVPTPDGGAKGFLIPVDAAIQLDDLTDPAPYLATCLSMNAVWETLDLCPAKHVLLIADACYSGLLARSRSVGEGTANQGIQVLAGMRARQVITAGGRGQRTRENPEWGHGAFTYKLLDVLRGRARVPGDVFTAHQLFAALQTAVSELTGGAQTPQFADKDTEGEFLFIVPGGHEPPAPPAIVPGDHATTIATVLVNSDPPGAAVLLGEAWKGTTPCTVTAELGARQTTALDIALACPGYQHAVRHVELARGTLATLNVTLEKIPVALPPEAAPPNPPAPPVSVPVIPPAPVPTPPPTPPAPPVKVRINPRDGAEMVLIPAGEFLLGSDGAEIYAGAEEEPRHRVYLDAFYIYKDDVTVAQYRKFCQATERAMPVEPAWGWHDDHPVVSVSWDDAAAYAAWAGVRLPTEAQWEKAARGGQQASFVWGNAWPPPKGAGNFADETCGKSGKYPKWSFVNGYDDGFVNTAPVGSFAPNGYGLHDMAGNVWQWCADWFDRGYYRTSPSHNPTGPATGTARVLRGGAWRDVCVPQYLRVARRLSERPSVHSDGNGFRCAALAAETE